jgi:hypothetical protein
MAGACKHLRGARAIPPRPERRGFLARIPVSQGDDISPLGSNPMRTAAELTAALAAMTAQLSETTAQLAEVKKTVRRSRTAIITIAASLILDLALTIVISVTAVAAHDASAQASATVGALHATQVSTCESGNQTRTQEVALWLHIYALSDVKHAPASVRKADDNLIAYIRGVFRPRNCKSVYHLQGS